MKNSSNSPLEWTADHPVFEIPEWEPMECGCLSPQEASRHFLIMGETGSGKSKSGVMPMIRSAFHYPSYAAYEQYVVRVRQKGLAPEPKDMLRPSMLIIDPKFELLDYILSLREASGENRNVVSLSLQNRDYIVHLFEGTDPHAQHAFDMAARILSISKYLDREKRSRDVFWPRQAEEIISSFLTIDHYIFAHRGVAGLVEFWQDVHNEVGSTVVDNAKKNTPEAERLAKLFRETYEKYDTSAEDVIYASQRLQYTFGEVDVTDKLQQLNKDITGFYAANDDFERGRYFDNIGESIEEILPWCEKAAGSFARGNREALNYLVDFVVHSQRLVRIGDKLANWPGPADTLKEGLREYVISYNKINYLQPFYTLLNLSTVYHTDSPAGDPVIEAYLKACAKHQVPPAIQLRIMSLPSLADKTYASIIAVINGVLRELAAQELAEHLSLNPYEPPEPEKFLSIEKLMETGSCLVYSPSAHHDSSIADIVGSTIKSKFFEFTLRGNRIRPFAYICDEFQRYISAEKDSGEQSFLDRCRAYRAVCTLATQSLASLEYALAASGMASDGRTSDASLRILINNTGNKFFFRNTDSQTQNWLMDIMPEPYVDGKPHLMRVRPTSTLLVGECYYMLSNGRIGRGRAHLQVEQTCKTVSQHDNEQKQRPKRKSGRRKR
jgi:hypothetical protein